MDLDRPESGIILALVIITGEKNRETQSNAGAGAVRRAAADTGRRQTPAGAIHTGRQNKCCGYGGPLRATDVEEQEKVGHCGPRTRRKERGKEGHTSTLSLVLSSRKLSAKGGPIVVSRLRWRILNGCTG